MRSCLIGGVLALVLLSPLTAADLNAQVPAVVIQDDSGRIVELDAHPGRIVSLVPVATEIIFSLGEGSRLVGRSRFDDYPPEVGRIPDVGDAIRPSVEAVLQRRPDLVILVGGSDNADAVREVERLGVPYLVLLFNSLENLQTNVSRLGQVVARPEEAADLWAGIERDLDEVSRAVAGKPRPAVYYDVGYPPAFTVGAGSYLNALVALAGGRNVFGDLAAPSPRVSLEAIVNRDPDVIVHPVARGAPSTHTSLRARPGWDNLRAVRSGAVVPVPADIVHRLGPRVGLAARLLAVALHPETREGLLP